MTRHHSHYITRRCGHLKRFGAWPPQPGRIGGYHPAVGKNPANGKKKPDDTEESTPKKVRNAETDWIPYTIVFGQREMESPKMPIRSRETGKVESLDLEEFAEKIRSATREGKPFRTINTPKLLSKRPIFVG